MNTVLIVDDHKFAVSILEYHLIQYGYQVLKAYDGNIALQIAKESKSKILRLNIKSQFFIFL